MTPTSKPSSILLAEGHQLDYLYADGTLAERATDCRMVPRPEVERYSDHVPVVAELT